MLIARLVAFLLCLAWNITTDHPAYIVRAEVEADVMAAVRFAHEHNLRLVVKNTGHGEQSLNARVHHSGMWADSFSKHCQCHTLTRLNFTTGRLTLQTGTDDQRRPDR